MSYLVLRLADPSLLSDNAGRAIIMMKYKYIRQTGSTDSIVNTDKQTDWLTDTNTIRQIQWKRT